MEVIVKQLLELLLTKRQPVQSYLSFPHIGQLLLLVLHVFASSGQYKCVLDARFDAIEPECVP
jgi:hypothetical protein